MKRRTVLAVFGTRPEAIKHAPVLMELQRRTDRFRARIAVSGQHGDILQPFLDTFGLEADHNLAIMTPGQSPAQVCSRVLQQLEPVLKSEAPDCVLVQGDTATTFAAALCAFYQQIPVAHIEAGLRTATPDSPFPEEMNRRLVTRLASFHFAATDFNRATLLREGVPQDAIFVTGNPVVDALHWILARHTTSAAVREVLSATDGARRIVLTTHRRESFGPVMEGNLRVLRAFVETHADASLIFPVHPNPNVLRSTETILAGCERVHLLPPQDYGDFIALLNAAWLIVSDSGGVQEEAPSLGRPLLVLRESTERPEAIECGMARLVGGRPERLAEMLREAYRAGSWIESVGQVENPFGRGDSARRICDGLEKILRGAPANESSEVSAGRAAALS